ncbi:hypothetical protein GB937_010740 [Aspergillus fischeri]|nr:hypothetical protein GB937_010740 [Aspergillus fischeri]
MVRKENIAIHSEFVEIAAPRDKKVYCSRLFEISSNIIIVQTGTVTWGGTTRPGRPPPSRPPPSCPGPPPRRPPHRAPRSAPVVGARPSGSRWIPLVGLHRTVALAGSPSAGVAAQMACTRRDGLAPTVVPGAPLPPGAAPLRAPDDPGRQAGRRDRAWVPCPRDPTPQGVIHRAPDGLLRLLIGPSVWSVRSVYLSVRLFYFYLSAPPFLAHVSCVRAPLPSLPRVHAHRLVLPGWARPPAHTYLSSAYASSTRTYT